MKEKKLLGILNIFAIGISATVGSGIFVMLGMGIGYTGHSVVLAVGLGCLFMVMAYLYQLILPSIFVFKGGTYSMKTMVMNQHMTGASVFVDIISMFTLAVYGISIVEYLSIVFPALEAYSVPLGLLIVTLFYLISIRGSKFVGVMLSLMTFILVASIGVFIVFGLSKVDEGFLTSSKFFYGGPSGFLAAFSIMGFACMGTSMVPINFSMKTKNPRKTLPKGILLATLGVGVIYALMGFVASGVLPIEEVAFQNLAVVSAAIFPTWAWAIFIIGGAVFAIATTLLGSIGAISAPFLKMAEDGWLPAVAKKKTKNDYPWVVQLTIYIINVVPIIFGFSLEFLVSLAMIPAMVICIYCNYQILNITKKYPKQWKSSCLHMPRPLLRIVVGIAIAFDLVLMVTLSGMLTPIQVGCIVLYIAGAFLYSHLVIKTGRVELDLERKQEQIVRDSDELERILNDSSTTKSAVETVIESPVM